jgi:ribosomal protein L40E
MTDQTEQSTAGDTHFCVHCGTKNDKGAYACNRCGERLIEVTHESSTPSGLNSCASCGGTNNTRAVYCWVCGSEMKDAVRIAPKVQPELQVPSAATPRTYRPDLNPVSKPATKPNIDGPVQQPDLMATGSDAEHDSQAASISQENPFGHADSTTPNSSGTRGGEVPREIKKWNWAAFLMPAVWGLFSGVPYTALLFVPPVFQILFGIELLPSSAQLVIQSGASVYLGFKGNKLAWRGKKWSSVEHFQIFQKQWTSWAVKLTVAVVGVGVLYVLFTAGT